MTVYCFIFRRILNRHLGRNKSIEPEEKEGKNLFLREKNNEWNKNIFNKTCIKSNIPLYLRTDIKSYKNAIPSPPPPIKCTMYVYNNLAAQTLNYCSSNICRTKLINKWRKDKKKMPTTATSAAKIRKSSGFYVLRSSPKNNEFIKYSILIK